MTCPSCGFFLIALGSDACPVCYCPLDVEDEIQTLRGKLATRLAILSLLLLFASVLGILIAIFG